MILMNYLLITKTSLEEAAVWAAWWLSGGRSRNTHHHYNLVPVCDIWEEKEGPFSLQCEIKKKIKVVTRRFWRTKRQRSQYFCVIAVSWSSRCFAKESIKQQIEGKLSRFFNIFMEFFLSLPLWAYSFNKYTKLFKKQQYEMSVFAAFVLRNVSDFASIH